MKLNIVLPGKIFAEVTDVERLVVETNLGSMGILPRRLDCVVIVVPGILFYESARAVATYVAIDAGILVKTGDQVRLSVRGAVAGNDLSQLDLAVKEQFLTVNDQDIATRSVMAKMEMGFIRRFARFQNG